MNHEQNTEYLQQLAAQLLPDLQAEVKHGHLCIGDMRIWTEARTGGDVVCLRTGYSQRRTRTFTRTERNYIATQVRRIVAEQTARDAARQAADERLHASMAREEAVAVGVQEAVTLVNEASCAAHYGRVVTQAEVTEVGEEGAYRYVVGFHLHGVTVAKAMAILSLIGADQPWLCDKRMAGIRCQLRAGHAGPHDCLGGLP